MGDSVSSENSSLEQYNQDDISVSLSNGRTSLDPLDWEEAKRMEKERKERAATLPARWDFLRIHFDRFLMFSVSEEGLTWPMECLCTLTQANKEEKIIFFKQPNNLHNRNVQETQHLTKPVQIKFYMFHLCEALILGDSTQVNDSRI